MSEELGHACEKAEAEKKPVFLLFTLKSCAPCKELKAHTLTHPKVSAWLKDSAVYHEMDATEHHAAVEHYKVRAVPCYLLVDPDGTERRRGSGHVTPGAFLKWAQE
jgi:thiol:disulfide interchange protein